MWESWHWRVLPPLRVPLFTPVPLPIPIPTHPHTRGTLFKLTRLFHTFNPTPVFSLFPPLPVAIIPSLPLPPHPFLLCKMHPLPSHLPTVSFQRRQQYRKEYPREFLDAAASDSEAGGWSRRQVGRLFEAPLYEDR